MRTNPTPEQLARLPKWARDHIRNLEQQRQAAVDSLDRVQAKQTPGPIWYDDWISDGKQRGPSTRKFYVNARGVNFDHNGIHLNVLLREEAIDLTWSKSNHLGGDVPMLPRSSGQVYLVHPKDLYGWPELDHK